MKNTTYANINESTVSTFARSDRWKALPFLILMLSTSLPLNYKLEPARVWAVADVAEMTMAAASSGNSMSSNGFVLFLAGLYGGAGWMLLRKPKSVGAVLTRQWPLLFLMLFIATSMLWSYYPEKVVSNIVHNFGVVFIAIAAALRYRHDPWLFPKHLGYVLGINMMLHVGGVILIPSYTIDWQSRWHGLATTPNTLGALAFTTLWVNAVVLICKKSDRYWPHLLFAGLAAVTMIGADSVTSMMCSMVAVLLIYLFDRFGKMGVGMNFYVSAIIIVSMSAMIVVMAGSAFDFSGLFGMFGRDANLTGRTSVWEDAFKAISMQPLWGWSFDDHAHLIASKGMPYSSYHNGFLDLAVSGGAIAVVLLLLLLGTWAMEFTRSSRIGSQIAPLSASFVIAYLIHNMSEASFVAPRGQLWQIFLVLLFLSACKKTPLENHDRDRSMHPEASQAPGLSHA